MKAHYCLIALALVFCFGYDSHAQENKDVFNFDALDFYSPEGTKSRIDLYIEVPLANFEFKKSKQEKSLYISSLDLTIEVYDKNDSRVYNAVTKEELSTRETGAEYLQQNSQILAKNLFLNSGTYKIKITIYENSSKRYSTKQKDVVVRDFIKEPFTISDLMIVSKLSDINGKKYITPSVTKSVGALDTFDVFFYVYKNNSDQVIDVTCKMSDANKKEVFSSSNFVSVIAGLFQNQFIIPIPTANLSYGIYTIEVTASNSLFNTSQTVTVDLGNSEFPYALNDIDKLIDQLQYIAKDSEMDFMKSGKSKEEKEKRFLDFWKSKDPLPTTKRNEVLNEYYKRLFYANKHFSTTYTEGWRTDMGMVFIIFGLPSNIDRHPYDMDQKPYEIWDYYEINKQFVFVDNSGFGDYRLITPIWDTFRYSNE